jgi:hypothetical protein
VTFLNYFIQSDLCDTISIIGENLKIRKAIKNELKKAGLLTECKEDYDSVKTEIKKYITAAIEKCSQSRRRKRSTGTLFDLLYSRRELVNHTPHLQKTFIWYSLFSLICSLAHMFPANCHGLVHAKFSDDVTIIGNPGLGIHTVYQFAGSPV